MARKSLLLVDHHLGSRRVFEAAAKELSVELVVAEDGQDGLDRARIQAPSLMVIRRDAPVLNAQAVSVLLKQSPATERIPVLVLCSSLTEQEREEFKDAGCDDCIKEPVELDAVVEKLKEWLKL